MENFSIRPVREEDDAALAAIIRKVAGSYGADPKTSILGDPVVDHMFRHYQKPRAAYYTVTRSGQIFGGAGIHPLDGGDEATCELQRMFLLPEARGKGIGSELMQLCIRDAVAFKYRNLYLETLSSMKEALKLYTASGFKVLAAPMGNTGHVGCGVWMVKTL